LQADLDETSSMLAVGETISTLVSSISDERSAAVRYMLSTAENVQSTATTLRAAYNVTDGRLRDIADGNNWPATGPNDSQLFNTSGSFLVGLQQVRQRTLSMGPASSNYSISSGNTTLMSVLKFYIGANDFLLDSIMKTTKVRTQNIDLHGSIKLKSIFFA